MKNNFLIIIISFLVPVFLLAQENNPILCADGIDNDGDGFVDCLDSDCLGLADMTNGCSICMNDGLSFVDTVIFFESMCATNTNINPQEAIGISNSTEIEDGNNVSLGEGGSILLGFTNNLLVNSGDSNPDVWIFEVGTRVETALIALRPYDQRTKDILIAEGIEDNDGNGYFELGAIRNFTSFLDIDAVIPNYSFFDLKFDAIQITDVVTGECEGPIPGADIDAVCALSSVSFDCSGVPNGLSIIDSCGVCLEPDNSNFNQSCSDCAGVPNGIAVVDSCGVCLEANDPNFNQSCIDCAGVLNGIMVLDECGVCLASNDPNFNQSCSDCAGVPNGVAEIDNCGVCLEPSDLDFDRSCIDCEGTLNGTKVLDSCGVCLEPSDPNFNQSCLDCEGIPNGVAIIDSCGICLEPSDPNFDQSCIDCEGTLNGMKVLDGCGVCLEMNDPTFNSTCTDCSGIVNGTKAVDNCGRCLELNDSNFNQSCLEKNKVYIPNTFSPNDDGINDLFQIFKDTEVTAYIRKYLIFNRWGDLLYEANDFEFSSNLGWWNGEFRGEKQGIDIYAYYIEIEFEDKEVKKYSGDIAILR